MASPTFATMAYLAGFAPTMTAAICGGNDPLLLTISGMAWMYGLMSVIHLPAWLQLIGTSRRICHSHDAARPD
ncbi:hypothetical protein TomMM35A_17690 [Sphingobium sp. TomMM35A]